MVRFVITGDYQVGNQEQVPNKVNLIQTINSVKPDVVLHCGDLTDLGENGSFINYAWYQIYNAIHKIDSHVPYPPQQLNQYKKEFVEQLHPEIELLECLGNHDTYAYPIQSVKSYIIDKFGWIYYKRKYDDLSVYCLSHYPNKQIADWLEQQIKIDTGNYVVFFHYPIVGPFSDDPKWWSREEQDYFYSKIKGTNCLAIYVGHTHTSSLYQFNEFIQYDGSGDSFWIADYKDGVLTHSIHSNHG